MHLSQRFVTMCFGLVFVCAMLAAPAAVSGTALDDYVAAPDASYTHSLARTISGPGYTAYVLDMTSQTWRDASEVNRTQWQHYVTIIKPDTVTTGKALLAIGGGSNDGNPSAPESVEAKYAAIAVATGSVIIELSYIPNQRIKFSDESDPRYMANGRTEDALIAYTWDKYMRGGDANWLARLPMTKAAVRAMDAVQEFCATPAGGSITVNEFVVMGGSKRGWTTWTTAVVDPRVIAIVPIVIDVLNVEASMVHHYAAYGFWAPAIWDYKDMGVMDWIGTDEFDAMMAIVDPYSYLDRLTMPKYMINSSGDDFFLPDSSQFYLDDLPGENYVRYVPNTDHSLDDEPNAVESLQSYYESIINATPRPQFSWTFEPGGSIRVETIDTPTQVKLWQATNPYARDFRKNNFIVPYPGPVYTETTLSDQGGGVYVGSVLEPPAGWTAFFVELEFNSGGTYPFTFTTSVRVSPEAATLDLDIVNEQWGHVNEMNPALPRHHRPNTPVTLTAAPDSGKLFNFWRIYDPNHPGDANHATIDADNPLTIVMAGSRVVEANFRDGLLINVVADPPVVAPGDSTTLTATPPDEFGPFTYSWNTGQSGPSITVSPTSTTEYTVTVTNSLSQPGQAKVTVKVVSRVTPLDLYVATPDPSYSYTYDPNDTFTGDDGAYTAYVLKMTSQTWREAPTEVDRSLWEHWVTIIVPTIRIVNDKALVWIEGGSYGDPPLDPTSDDDVKALFSIASNTGSVVVLVTQIPNNPLVFPPETHKRSEDAILAHSFRKAGEEYQITGDPNTTWPALLPMVKATVRTMDTAQDFLSNADIPTQLNITGFVVAGGSKRGWTSWLTAAVDQPRVIGIMPVVIDMLNMDMSMDHHYAAYDGDYAEHVGDYVTENVMQQLNTEMGQELLKVIDPFEYRDRFASLPKYMLNATGDEFFVPDSAQFYYHDLPGDKWLRYVANVGHMDVGTPDAVEGLIAFYLSVIMGLPRPQITWTLEGDDTIRVQTSGWMGAPPTARLWQGHVDPNPSQPNKRDFRRFVVGDIWTSSPLVDQGGGVYVGQVDVPETGWTGFYVELSGTDFPPYRFSTQVRIVPEIDPYVTLTATANSEQSGLVEVTPAPHVAGTTDYRIDTEVMLTALAEPNHTFVQWRAFDPAHPGDANYATDDSNNPLTIMMEREDREVMALFANDGEFDVRVDADPTVIPEGGSSTLTADVTGAAAPITYSWNTGQTDPSITVQLDETTQFSVTVTDALGRQTTDDVTVVVGPLLTVQVQAEPNVVLAGQSSTLTATPSGGHGDVTYAWSTGQVGRIIEVVVSQATEYTVTATDGLNQLATANVTVTVAEDLTVTALAEPKIVLPGQSSTLTAIESGGQGPYTYKWDTGDEASEITVSPSKTTTYTVTVTDNLDQQAQASVTVAGKLADAQATADPAVIAVGGSSTLAASVTGGIEPYSYTWRNDQSKIVGQAATVSVSPLVTTSYTVEIADALGQVAQASVSITVGPALLASASAAADSIIAGGSTTLSATATGGIAPYTFTWDNGQIGDTVTVNPTQTTTYEVTVTDSQNNQAKATVRVVVAQVLTVTAGADPSVVATGQACTLAATYSGGQAPFTHEWSNGMTGLSIRVYPTTTQTYTITTKDALDQEATADVTVTVASLVEVSASASPENIYRGQSSLLTATASGGVEPYSYSWDTKPPKSGQTISVSPNASRPYTVTVQDAKGQNATASVSVAVTRQYNLTVNTQGQGTVDNQGGTYDQGTTITILAKPADTWHFAFWGGTPMLPTGSASTNPLTVVMNADRNLTAMFVPKQDGDTGQTTPNPLLPTTWCGAIMGAGQMGLYWAACGVGLAALSWRQRRARR